MDENYADLFTVAAARVGLQMSCPDCRESWVIATPEEPVITLRDVLEEATVHWHECGAR
jgi:hypothetical protein